MSIRTSIVTASVTLALFAPAFTGTAAADPIFRDGTHSLPAPSVKKPGHKITRVGQGAKTSKSSKSACSFSPRLCRQLV